MWIVRLFMNLWIGQIYRELFELYEFYDYCELVKLYDFMQICEFVVLCELFEFSNLLIFFVIWWIVWIQWFNQIHKFNNSTNSQYTYHYSFKKNATVHISSPLWKRLGKNCRKISQTPCSRCHNFTTQGLSFFLENFSWKFGTIRAQIQLKTNEKKSYYVT